VRDLIARYGFGSCGMRAACETSAAADWVSGKVTKASANQACQWPSVCSGRFDQDAISAINMRGKTGLIQWSHALALSSQRTERECVLNSDTSCMDYAKCRLCTFMVIATVAYAAVNVYAAATSSISQFGVTFRFAQPVVYGTFANNDYWVLAPVTIVEMTPDWDGTKNGWEVNPKCVVEQGFDARGPNYSVSKRPALPLTLTTNCSLVKVIGNSSSVDGSYVNTAVVLTVLAEEPPDHGASCFRPPYSGDAKPLIFTNALRTALLPRYPMPPSAVSLDEVRKNFSKCLRMDHHPRQPRAFRPTSAMAGYQPENALALNEAMLRLMGDDPPSVRWPALLMFTQHALDRAFVILQGYRRWDNGHNPNHRVLGAWAAILLDLPEVQNNLRIAEEFHEDIYLYESPIDRRALWGEASSEKQYWNYIMGLGGSRSNRDPYGFIDGGRLSDASGAAYQVITSQSLKGQALVYRLFAELRSVVPMHRLVILDRYAERWVTHGVWALPDPVAAFDGEASNYGVTFGPDGKGSFIKGNGRFPSVHGVNADGGQYKSRFVADMWQSYGTKSWVSTPPRAPKPEIGATQR